ncbi:ankyrin repeat-containing domain protein [Aspergillus undulatus]|uniref:ankyrin repeat-containing domain protein n=1 Tax=Aspergillus undulatus TaxID=1810928 RepID=UPI003CCE1611
MSPGLPPEIIHIILTLLVPGPTSWEWGKRLPRDERRRFLALEEFNWFLNLRLVNRLFDELLIDIFLAAIRAGNIGYGMPLRRGPATPSTMAMGQRLLSAAVQRHRQCREKFNYGLVRTVTQGVDGAVALFSHSHLHSQSYFRGENVRNGHGNGNYDAGKEEEDPLLLERNYLAGIIALLVGIVSTWLVIDILAEGRDLGDLDEGKGEVLAAVMMTAAYLGRLDHMSILLEMGVPADSDPDDKWVYPPSMAAALAGRGDVLTFLVKKCGADMRVPTVGSGDTVLHFAALGGHDTLVRNFLDIGIKADVRNNSGETPLHYAAGGGHARAVRELIERGKANVKVRDHWDVAPLIWASARGNDAVVAELLKSDTVSVDCHGSAAVNTPVFLAAILGHEKVFHQLFPRTNAPHSSILYMALIGGKVSIVKAIIEADAGVLGDYHTNRRETTLFVPAIWGNEEVLRYLLSVEYHNAINAHDARRRTALQYAVCSGDAGTVRALLEHPDLAINSNKDRCLEIIPLKFDIDDGDFTAEILDALLNHPNINLNINIRKRYRQAPLMPAVRVINVEALRFLLTCRRLDRPFVGSV